MKKALMVSAGVVFSCLFHVISGHAGEPTDRVRGMLQEVLSIQNDSHLQGDAFRAKRRTSIKGIIGKNFDFDKMAERALESKWKELNNQQRLEFRNLFRDLFQDSYTRLVLDFLKDEKILYNGEEKGPERALVKTVLVRPQEQISVEYVLSPAKGGWLFRDVRIDGVSILDNYQKSFTRVIQRESYQSLLQRMRLQQRSTEESS